MPDPHGLRARLLAGKTAAELTDNEVDELFDDFVQLLESEPDAPRDKHREHNS